MRVGFIQLPVPDHGAHYAKANRPLAAGYMVAFARRHRLGADWEAEILPDHLADYGGDAAILDWMLHGGDGRGGFDAVFFTLYLWNRDRSLFLARAAKRRRPTLLTVAGGPEVTPEACAGRIPADFPGIDILCVGEGEEFFAGFLDRAPVRGDGRSPDARPVVHTAREVADLGSVPNPYLEGIVPVRSGDIVHFEQMRGCASRCAYCYYGKNSRRERLFPPERVSGVFRLAVQRGASEVYFMDPTLNGRAGLTDHLRLVARHNPAAIPIHAEVRLESIDAEVADAMAAAGVRSVEAGLQSSNPRALAAVGRPADLGAFARGARLLQERGVEIRTGVIIGLPEDGLGEFLSTLDFLEDVQLLATAECYVLAALPGTALRRGVDAGRWGMVAMARPPYWVRSTSKMAPEDFCAAIEILERRQGIDYFPPVSPKAPEVPAPLVSELDLRRVDLATAPSRQVDATRLANSVTVLLDAEVAESPRFGDWAAFLMEATPHTCWRLVCRGGKRLSPQDRRRVRGAFHTPGHFLNQGAHLRGGGSGGDAEPESVRFFQEGDAGG
ncbi:MAG: radical SAM protein [Acidobacteriota bacterium]|jgi:hypothetical protein|nr:radical SAM protein [Acidobacteriota bacterium]